MTESRVNSDLSIIQVGSERYGPRLSGCIRPLAKGDVVVDIVVMQWRVVLCDGTFHLESDCDQPSESQARRGGKKGSLC